MLLSLGYHWGMFGVSLGNTTELIREWHGNGRRMTGRREVNGGEKGGGRRCKTVGLRRRNNVQYCKDKEPAYDAGLMDEG